nr:MAG TPA: hypothetical protein [Caudoviricetes sp.]
MDRLISSSYKLLYAIRILIIYYSKQNDLFI